MNIRSISLTLAAGVLLVAPSILVAQGPGFGVGAGGGDCPQMMGRRGGEGICGGHMLLGPVGDKIGLTDEQRTEIEAILEAARQAAEPLRERLDAEREAFRSTHEPGSFDEAAFRVHAESQAALHVELQVQRMKAAADAHAVLTAEQQQELKELRELMGELGHRRGGRGGKRGRG